jgi:CO/xanthine dehydrogenase Mo-binding subunit
MSGSSSTSGRSVRDARAGLLVASVICASLAREAGRAVKLLHTREEEFLASHPRMPMRYWVRLGFHRDGRVAASAVDCGTVIHPAAAEGRVHGAVTQGIGLAMVEYVDWYNGAPTNPQLVDYPIPSAMMLPRQHVAFADSYEPSGPYGAKGIGEIGLDAIPAAIANAIADAVGVRGSVAYKRAMAVEFAARALLRAWERTR